MEYQRSTHSYSQNPNVETRFQLIIVPTVAKIFLIIASGARSLIFPTKTVITGPADDTDSADAGGFIAFGVCAVEFGFEYGCCAEFGADSIDVPRAYNCGPDRYALACDGGG